MPARSGQNSGRLNTTLLGSTTIEDLIVFSKRIINLIVLLCESLSSNTTWNLCFSQFWSFEKTSFYNGTDLYESFDLFRAAIGYVPQQDIVHRKIAVARALGYTARLRLPADT